MTTTMTPELRELIEAVHYRPAVSIIMPFEPKMSLKTELMHSLKFAADKIELELKENAHLFMDISDPEHLNEKEKQIVLMERAIELLNEDQKTCIELFYLKKWLKKSSLNWNLKNKFLKFRQIILE